MKLIPLSQIPYAARLAALLGRLSQEGAILTTADQREALAAIETHARPSLADIATVEALARDNRGALGALQSADTLAAARASTAAQDEREHFRAALRAAGYTGATSKALRADLLGRFRRGEPLPAPRA